MVNTMFSTTSREGNWRLSNRGLFLRRAGLRRSRRWSACGWSACRWRAQTDVPVIRAEGLRGEAIFVKQIRPWGVARPRVAHGDRFRHRGAGDGDGFAFDDRVGPDELLVGACDDETHELCVV